MTFKSFDVVLMPFPFADRRTSVVRPAVILTDYDSFGRVSGVAMAAMITSAKRSIWPADVPITDLRNAGLTLPCVIRMKLNAVDYVLMDKKIGEIADIDKPFLRDALRKVFSNVFEDV